MVFALVSVKPHAILQHPREELEDCGLLGEASSLSYSTGVFFSSFTLVS